MNSRIDTGVIAASLQRAERALNKNSEAAPNQPVQAPPQPTAPPVGALTQTVDRRNASQPSERLIGRVVSCDGGFATLSASATDMSGSSTDFWSIGRLISISTPHSRVVGLVYKIDSDSGLWKQGQNNNITISIELVGEITESIQGVKFSRGISNYPPLGSIAHRIRATDLAIIHQPIGKRTAVIGQLTQDNTIPAVVSIDDMVNRHFAIVGTTGTGKSTSVSLIIRKIVEARNDLRVLILDPHNEYTKAFNGKSVNIAVENLDLPFWLFQAEEFNEVIFRGREGVEEEVDALRDLIPQAKAKFNSRTSHSSALLKRENQVSSITVDTPLPYRMTDLLGLIEEEIGQLEGRHSRAVLRSLKNRLLSLINDPRFRFMFSQRTMHDNMREIVGQIFRVPIEGKPITTFQLAGMPSEVVNSVVSVLCRIAFDLAVWSKGNCEVLVMCEEAHRYVPQDIKMGFIPTRQAIARIAKEGRKYGAYLGVVTQRPGELDPTILSQCSTVFAMRLANEMDQEIIRSAISDSSSSTISFLSAIGNQEAIAFGEGIATPMRMRFSNVENHHIPGDNIQNDLASHLANASYSDLNQIIESMRTMHDRKG